MCLLSSICLDLQLITVNKLSFFHNIGYNTDLIIDKIKYHFKVLVYLQLILSSEWEHLINIHHDKNS